MKQRELSTWIQASLTALSILLVASFVQAGSATTQPADSGPGAEKHEKKRDDSASWLHATLEAINITGEQKVQIRNLISDAHQAREKWRADHEAELKGLKDEFEAAVHSRNKSRIKSIADKASTLWATAPKFTETLAKIRTILTAEQQPAFDAAIQAKRDALGEEAASFFEDHPSAKAGAGRRKGGNKGTGDGSGKQIGL